MMNQGYLRADRTAAADECFTPHFAVAPLLEFIPYDWRVWCPFDEDFSAFYRTFKENGYTVHRSSLVEGQNFFDYKPPDNYDVIISNPPYSIKDRVLSCLYELNKPFAMLMPIATLQGKARFKLFKQGLELLVFDSRVPYHTQGDFEKPRSGVHFGSAYFCKGILPDKLVFRELNKFNRPLKREEDA